MISVASFSTSENDSTPQQSFIVDCLGHSAIFVIELAALFVRKVFYLSYSKYRNNYFRKKGRKG